MRDAAVGFQCPNCVAEGAKTTRAGRATYGGKRSDNPTTTSLALIAINALVWVAVVATGGNDSWVAARLMLSPLGRCYTEGFNGFYPTLGEPVCETVAGATWVMGLDDGAWWQAVTHGFTHVGLWHIALNAIGIWVLGPPLERAFGRLRFLAIYLVATLTAGAMVFWLADPLSRTLGASGGVFGLMGALMVIAWKVHGDVRSVLSLLVVNLVFTFAMPGISWQGHVGGLIGGAAAAAILAFAPRGDRRSWWQAAGLAALTLATLALIVLRAQILN